MGYSDKSPDIVEFNVKTLASTTDVVATMLSYLGFLNSAYGGDNASRIYILPKASITSGAGGVLKIFGDAYHLDATNYRDFGIYFSADQLADTGSNGKGVFWLNGKVNGSFMGLNPDIGLGFQDGLYVVGRYALVNNNPALIIGPTKGKYHGTYSVVGLELQKDMIVYKDKLIRFEDELGGIATGLRYNSTSQRTEELFKGNLIRSVGTNTHTFNHAIVKNTLLNITDAGTTTTPSILASNRVKFAQTTPATITNFINGYDGQTVICLFTNTNTTIQNNANIILKGGVDYTPTAGSELLTLENFGGVWYEVSRSVNHV